MNEVEIVVKVRDQATAEVAALEARVKALKDASASAGESAATFSTDLDDEGLRAKVIEAVRVAERNIAVIVGIDLEDEGLREKVIEAVKAAERGINAIVGADVDADGLRERVKAEAAAAGAGTKIRVPIEGDTSNLEQDVTSKTKRTKPEPIKVSVEADAAQFERDFRAAMDEGQKVSDAADRTMRGSFTAMASGSRSLRAAMADLQPAAEDAGRAVEDAGNKADNAGRKAATAASGFGVAALKMPGLIAGALALAPALAAIPAVTAAVVVGAGAMTLGFGGVISALKDYGAQSTSSGQSGAQMAQTAFSNAVAIRNAEQAITDAKKQAAQAAQSSADQIYSAQERVTSSAYSLSQAEQTLQDAEKSETQAQQALTQARVDAANQLKDLNNSAADSTIAVQQAELNLQEARESLVKTTGSSLSTDDQKRQAQIDLLSATQGLQDAQQRQLEAQQAANAANKAGVDGMSGVVSAQDAVAKGAQGVASAQHGVTTAAQEQSNAQTALTRAIQASANQQTSSAEAIQKAVQNLADTQKQQALAAAAAAATGGGAVNKFAQDMAKLTPAGRAFVNQLLSMKSGFDQLKSTAQTSMLPGFMPLLDAIKTDMPGINNAVGQMGKLIGGVGTQLGKLLQSPAFRGELSKIWTDGLGAAQKFADSIVPMVKGVTDAVSKAGPIVSGLADGFSMIMKTGIPAFFQGLVTGAQGSGDLFRSLGGIVSDLLGPLGTLAGTVSSSLGPVFVALRPVINQLATILVQALLPVIKDLSPWLTMTAHLIGALMPVIGPVLIILGKLADTFLKNLLPAIQPLIPLIQQAATTIGKQLLVSFDQILPSLVDLIQSFAKLLPPLMPLIPLVAQLAVLFLEMAGPALKTQLAVMSLILLALKPLADVIGWVVTKILPPFSTAVKDLAGPLNALGDASKAAFTWVQTHMGDMVSWIKGLPGKLASAGSGMWDWLGNSFKSALNMIIGWWDSLSFTTPHFHIPGIGDTPSVTIGMPYIPKFAAGGALGMGGLSAIIGDAGAEVMKLPDGTQIMPHANTQSMLAQGAGVQTVRVELDWALGSDHGDELLTWLRKNIRIRGGGGSNSVQRVLGQAS